MCNIKNLFVYFFLLFFLLSFSAEVFSQRKRRNTSEEESTTKSGSTVNIDKETKKQLVQGTWERKFQQGISFYKNEQYEKAESLFVYCSDRAENESLENQNLTSLWHAKTLTQLGRYIEANQKLLALESQLGATPLRQEVIFDKAVIATHNHNHTVAAELFVSLLPVGWRPLTTENPLLIASYYYLFLLSTSFLSDAETRYLINTTKNSSVRVLFALKAIQNRLYKGDSQGALNDIQEFQTKYPLIDTDDQRRFTDLKLIANQIKNGAAKILRVGVLAPALLKPFDNSNDAGATNLVVGIEQAKEESNRLSQSSFMLLSIKNTAKLAPESMVDLAKSLIENDSVSLIVGPLYSDEALLVSAFCATKHIPMITPTATDEQIASTSSQTFQLNPTLKERGAAMARFSVKDLHAKTAAVFVQDSTYGKDMGTGFKSEFEKLGGEVKVFGLLPEKFSSFAKVLAPLELKFDKQSGYPRTQLDVIYLPMTSSEAVAIAISQLRYYNIAGELLGSSDWLDTRLLNNRELLTNFYFASDFQLIDNSSTNFISNTYKIRFASEPDAFFWLGFDTIYYLGRILFSNSEYKNIETAIKLAPIMEMHHIPVYFNGGNINTEMNYMRFSNGAISRVR